MHIEDINIKVEDIGTIEVGSFERHYCIMGGKLGLPTKGRRMCF